MPSSPAAGFRSVTTHDTKRRKSKTGNNWSLDQAVGCNEWLGGAKITHRMAHPYPRTLPNATLPDILRNDLHPYTTPARSHHLHNKFYKDLTRKSNHNTPGIILSLPYKYPPYCKSAYHTPTPNRTIPS